MRILVTGANGYLGQGIVKAIIESGNKVIATDFKLDNVDTRATKIELPGTIIEENCIIGAGTVIKGKIPKNSVVIGNPSRIVSNTLEWAEKKQMEKEYIYEKKEFN